MTPRVNQDAQAKRLRIALVSPWRFDDPHAWSGMIPRIFAALSEVADVIPISTADQPTSLVDRAAAKVVGTTSGRGYLWEFGIATSISRGRLARRRVRAAAPDVVVGVAASTDIAFLGDVNVPIVQIVDATFEAIQDFYPMFSNLHPLSRRQAEIVAERSTRATAMFVASSQWAIDSLVRDYAVGTHQCVLAQAGPGIAPNGACDRPDSSPGRFRALVVARDWYRKGGEAAVEAIRRARDRRLPISLTVVGEAPGELPEWVEDRGRLDAEGLELEYRRADVLIELAVANAAGVTLTDAAAHGLPVIAADVGGVDSIVRDRETGILVPVGEPYSANDLAERAADALVSMSDPVLRERMSVAARAYACSDLNWDVWARRALAACEQALANRKVWVN